MLSKAIQGKSSVLLWLTHDRGVMGGLLTLNSFVTVFPDIDTTKSSSSTSSNATTQGMHLNANLLFIHTNCLGITIASYNLGCFFGAIFCIWIGNYLGRRKTIFTGSIIMVIGATLQASAYSLPHLIVGRIITGIGNGMNTSTVPTWQSGKYSSLLEKSHGANIT